MPLPRPFALIQTEDQWLRASHENTALEAGVVQLAFEDEPAAMPAGGSTAPGAGLAFDGHCRLYHSLPREGRVTRQLWPHRQAAAPLDLFAAPTDGPVGDFRPASGIVPVLREPRGLVVDGNDRLFIAEAGARRILVFDLWSERLLRQIPVAGHPLDLALLGRSVVAVLTSPTGLLRLDARSGPRPLPLPAAVLEPVRVAVCPQGKVFVLDRAGTGQARVLVNGRPSIDVPFATDIEFLPGPVLVAARLPGQDFLRLRLGPESIEELPPLKARDYDGLGIVRTPDERIGFFTANGFRHAVPARVRYVPRGRVISFRLDSGEFRTLWGRLFLDACIPQDTTVHVQCVATDDPPEDEDTFPRKLPANVREALITRPDLSPPMPPESLVPLAIEQTLHRRETGRELPFAAKSANDPFETYEAPIIAGAGRFLWFALELRGNTRFTPRVRALRAEYPSHDYLRRLPKVFSRDDFAASFLRRYLAMFDGFFGELDVRATARQALLDPQGAPAEILPWLAGFLGLVLDERWPVETQRTMIQEAAWLFRFRGTVPGLSRFLELYTGTKVILIEQFRLRGLGTVGEPGGPQSRAILGGGFRVGGALGDATAEPLSGSATDAFNTHAHRFSVMIPAALSVEQLDVVRQILEVHRPAHTIVEVCTVDSGMRVGRGLHLGLTSVIGRSGGFAPLQTGASLLGRGVVIGRPGAGTTVESSRLGKDSRVG
jgi:phage tail-like protein